MLMFYRIVEFSGEPKNRDFETILWAPRDRLREYDFLEGDAEFLQSIHCVAIHPPSRRVLRALSGLRQPEVQPALVIQALRQIAIYQI